MTATINPGKFPANPANTGTTLHLRDIVKSIPREYFQKNAVKAWTQVAITLVSVTLSYVALAYSPWFLLPLRTKRTAIETKVNRLERHSSMSQILM